MLSTTLTKNLTILFLSIAGLLVNYFPLPLFFGVDVLFGSIASLIAVRLYGTVAGVVVVIVSSSYTMILWGHPYAFIIFSLEVFTVGMLLHRRVSSLVQADAMYWLFIGMPLVWISYSYFLNLPDQQVWLIMLKQSFNGIANSIITTHLLLLSPRKLLRKIAPSRDDTIKLQELLFITLLSIAFITSLVMINQFNKAKLDDAENNISLQFRQHAQTLDSLLDSGIKLNSLLFNNMFSASMHFDAIIYNNKDEIMLSTLSDDEQKTLLIGGTHQARNKNLAIWFPDRNQLPLMKWWNQSYFYARYPLWYGNFSYVTILTSSKQLINASHQQNIYAFSLLLVVILIGGIFAYVVSRIMTITINQLTASTENISSKLQSNQPVTWPNSRITELNLLSIHAQQMSKDIENTLNDINRHARAIIDGSVDAIITVNMEGNIVGFNPAATKMFGYNEKDIQNQNLAILIPEADRELHYKHVRSSINNDIENPMSRRREVYALHKSGRIFPIDISLNRVKMDNGIHYTAIISDISERKASDKLKQEFISTVSHELRTPLTAISGSVKLLQPGVISDQAEQQAILDITVRNIDRLSELINDLLDFEKIQASGLTYNLEPTHTSDILEQVVQTTQPVANRHNIQLSLSLDYSCMINVDARRISQVMTNFISNAIKFSQPGNEIIIGSHACQAGIRLYVRDFGSGIPASFRKHIFSRFSQADSSDKKLIQKGTGLGLAISKNFTENMGGTIGFESEEGKGSIFYVDFSCINDADK